MMIRAVVVVTLMGVGSDGNAETVSKAALSSTKACRNISSFEMA